MADTRRILGFALTALLLQVILLLLSDIPINSDGMARHLGSKYVWAHPAVLADLWYRPLTVMAFLPGAWAGYYGSVAINLLITGLLCIQTSLLARDLGLRKHYLAIPFLILQVTFLRWSTQVMSEFLFALLLVSALRSDLKEKGWWGSALISCSVLVRPEGVLVAGVWGLWLLCRRRVREIPLLAVGPLFWMGVSALTLGSPLAMIQLNAYPSFRLHLSPSRFSGALRIFDEAAGAVVFVLLEAGAVFLLFRNRDPQKRWSGVHVVFGSYLFAIAVLFPAFAAAPKDYFPLGLARHLNPTTPWFALLALRGLNALDELRDARPRLRRGLVLFLSLQIILLAGTVAVNTARGKPYTSTLALLTLAAVLTSLPFFPRIPRPPRFGWTPWLLAIALLVITLKVRPLRPTTTDRLTRQAAAWIDERGLRQRPLMSGLPGIFYLLDKDPFAHGIHAVNAIDIPTGGLWVWDDWAAERHMFIDQQAFASGERYRKLQTFQRENRKAVIYERLR